MTNENINKNRHKHRVCVVACFVFFFHLHFISQSVWHFSTSLIIAGEMSLISGFDSACSLRYIGQVLIAATTGHAVNDDGIDCMLSNA